jgi:hypothetical protein
MIMIHELGMKSVEEIVASFKILQDFPEKIHDQGSRESNTVPPEYGAGDYEILK